MEQPFLNSEQRCLIIPTGLLSYLHHTAKRGALDALEDAMEG